MKSKEEQKKGKVKQQDTKPRNKNWFGEDTDYAITETIRKKGRLGGRKLG